MRACVFVVALVAVASLSTVADAHGYCEDDIATKLVVDLETLANGKAATPDNWGDCVAENIAQNKQLTARLVTACTTILAANPDDTDCIVWSIEVGARTLGTVDLFERFAKNFPPDAFDGTSFGVYVTLDDARALPLVREAWARAAADKRSKNPSRNRKYLLAVWYHEALAVFQSKGTTEDATFLTVQLPAASDKGVIRKMHRVIAAIEKREKTR